MISTGLFEYKILSKDYINNPQNLEDLQEVYQLWTRVWTGMLAKAGCPEVLVADDFYRAHFIPVIKYEGRIIGSASCTVFDLRNPIVKDLKYFSIYPDHVKNWFTEQKLRHVMSVEWLTCDYEFRTSKLGFSLAEVMIQLSYKIMQEMNVDMIIGAPLKAAGVDKLGKNLGTMMFVDHVVRGKLECCIMGMLRQNVLQAHPEKKMNDIIEMLWNNRQYASQLDNNSTKKAA